MAERVKRRYIGAKSHEFIDIIALNEFIKSEIFISKSLARNLFIAEKVDVIARIEGKSLPFILVHATHEL